MSYRNRDGDYMIQVRERRPGLLDIKIVKRPPKTSTIRPWYDFESDPLSVLETQRGTLTEHERTYDSNKRYIKHHFF